MKNDYDNTIRDGEESFAYLDYLKKKSLEKGIIVLNGYTGLDMAEKVALEIEQLASMGQKKIRVIICSQGGSVFAGLAIFDALQNFKTIPGNEVITEARGYAASMGAIILQAGTKRYATKNTRILIHEVSAGTLGREFTVSTAEEEARELKKVNQQLLDILANASGMTTKKISTLTKKRDYWMSAEEAKDSHFIDEVI